MKFKALPVLLTAFSLMTLTIVPSDAYAMKNGSSHTQVKQEKVLRGNYSSGIYHNAYCKHYKCKKCTVIFTSAAEAKNKGYRACKKCGG